MKIKVKQDSTQHFVKLLMEGVEFPFIYEVNEETSNRICEALKAEDQSAIWFSTNTGTDVLFRIGTVQLAEFLWETPGRINEESLNEGVNTEWEMRIHFRGTKSPYEACVDEPIQAYDVFFYFEIGEDRAISFEDADGEQVVFNRDQVILIEGKSKLIEEGSRDAEKESKS